MFEQKLSAVEARLHPQIKSGNVMISVQDRDWLLSTLKRYMEKDSSWHSAAVNHFIKEENN